MKNLYQEAFNSTTDLLDSSIDRNEIQIIQEKKRKYLQIKKQNKILQAKNPELM